MSWPLRNRPEASQPRLDDEARARLWNQLAERLSRAPAQTRFRLQWVAGAGVAAVTAALLLTLVFGRTSGALYTQDGYVFQELRVAPGSASSAVTLTGGVQLEATSDTLLTNLVANEHEVVLQLTRGKVQLSIPPGGARRWSIEAGIVSVEVVGTVLSVARDSDTVRVSVSRGAVLVRSPHLADGVARVAAGSTLSVARPTEVAPQVPQLATADAKGPEIASAATDAPSARRNTASVPAARPPASAAPVPRSSAHTLLEQADAARLNGDFTRAEALLNRVLEEHPGDALGASVLFTLGVVQTQAGRSPGVTVTTFRRALAQASAKSLREDCYQRLVEALLVAGDHSGAEATLSSYEAEFASGRHRTRLQRLVRDGAQP